MIGGTNKNPLHAKVQSIAMEVVNSFAKPTKGIVYHYNNEHNYAMVEIDNPYGGGVQLLQYVPVQMVGGMHIPGPFPGDEVWIEFTAGKFELPKIVSFADREYSTNTRDLKFKHDKKGAFVSQSLSKTSEPDWHQAMFGNRK